LEAIVARPELAAQGSNRLRSVLDDAPAELGLVVAHVVEEVACEHRLLARNHILLLLVLHCAEVHPTLQAEGLVTRHSTEGLVELDLVKRREFEGTARDGAAGAVDFAHGGCESVQLSEVLGWQHNSSGGVDDPGRLLRLDEHSVELPREEAAQIDQLAGLLGLHGR